QLQEKLKQYKLVDLENSRLETELDAHKQEIISLRQERDALLSTISKLDVELTRSEYIRLQQQK
ncbi:unnamed protein product, partial [Didymodactylos carnosus]